jgi:hypothetical protein
VGQGADPQEWVLVQGDTETPVHDGLLAEWNTTGFSDGLYTIRVVVFDTHGNEMARRVSVNVAQPDEPQERDDSPPPGPPPEPPAEEPSDAGKEAPF